ncbi:MAG: alginate export family protein [Candidatus Eisenbacteria bacterium]|uniref:Alginate export family protein n=1 Tax=Eiseniibacteriota bacterium TaxID=2212470 RepID=A0A956NC19_UNCEI|nr:alginate export family protein [Candidatus Eisenbacteria bacterium]
MMWRFRVGPSMSNRNQALAALAFAVCLTSSVFVDPVRSEDEMPTGVVADAGGRSRLTVRGEYVVETFSQKNFHLGDGPIGETSSDYDAFWAQNLLLRPRFIVSDNLNVNLSVDVAQGVWGFDGESDAGVYPVNPSLSGTRVDWAYLAYRHAGTATRWYVGRQPFTLGHGLVLETDAAGVQVYRDLSRIGSLGLGVAKIYESGGFSDRINETPDSTRVGRDGRDADLFFAELAMGDESLSLRPFFVYYVDRSGGDGDLVYPDQLPYLEARFQPGITRATAFGLSFALRRGLISVEGEYDNLRGVDRLGDANFGPDEIHDVNNGDLTGANLYLRGALGGARGELGVILAQGSGDEDPRTGEGNITRIATDGGFFITEVWEDSVMPDRGYYPGGLGSPLVRGYRELENTKIVQGFASFRPTPNLRLFASVSMIRASEALREWSDANGNGVLEVDEFGPGTSTELGSELDVRIEWAVDRRLQLELAAGRFLPRVASSYLLYGHDQAQEAANEIRATITVPIPEFSLGG